jgi:hypothetical protein
MKDRKIVRHADGCGLSLTHDGAAEVGYPMTVPEILGQLTELHALAAECGVEYPEVDLWCLSTYQLIARQTKAVWPAPSQQESL